MIGEYTEDEIHQLHNTLYDILAEIDRVCKKLNIQYFIQGGTAIGAYFEQAILPWDDDIDIGLTRENYNRFLQEAPELLNKRFFLQWLGTDPHTPFYFAKVRMNDTIFLEHNFRNLNMHQGIYIDVFPYDKVPNSLFLQKSQRLIGNFLNCCFMGKDIWQWKHCGKCQIDNPTDRGYLICLFQRIIATPLSKSTIYKLLCWSQSCFNFMKKATFYNMVLMPKDHIEVSSIENLQIVPFGPLKVSAPADIYTYIKRHYRNLRRFIPKEEQRNHHPDKLKFAD